MTIEFIGIAATAPHSETEIAPHQANPDQAGPVQPGYLEELARAHEDAGFDRVLVAHSSVSPDGLTVADARDYGALVRLVREQADPAPLASAR